MIHPALTFVNTFFTIIIKYIIFIVNTEKPARENGRVLSYSIMFQPFFITRCP